MQAQNKAQKAQRDMTKAERRELQERQKAGKQLVKAKQRNEQPRQPPSFLATSSLSQSNILPQIDTTIQRVPTEIRFDDPRITKKVEKSGIIQRVPSNKPVALFSHLNQYMKPSNMKIQHGVVHPDIISLGLQFSEFVITGGNARCLAMLNVFKNVLLDYITPSGTSLQRHLTTHLSKQIDFLTSCRVLAPSMKNAIRHLKYEISILNIDLPDMDAKASLCEEIDAYINSRITAADQRIVTFVIGNIHDGDVVLTHARSSVVLAAFQAARDRGIKFRVIVADSRPKYEGKELLKRLVDSEIPCSYILTNALGSVMKEVTKVILGASSILSNGAVMSRVGTAVVTMMAHEYQVPVIVCCETYKFADHVRLDSFVWNEIGDPDELLNGMGGETCPARLPSVVPCVQAPIENVWLKDWREPGSNLSLLCLHYDVTPAVFITMVIMEIGIYSSTSVVSMLRDMNEKKR